MGKLQGSRGAREQGSKGAGEQGRRKTDDGLSFLRPIFSDKECRRQTKSDLSVHYRTPLYHYRTLLGNRFFDELS